MPGTVYCLSVGLDGIPEDSSDATYSLLIGETVEISEDGAAKVLSMAKKEFDDISFEFKNSDDEAEDDAEDDKTAQDAQKLLEESGIDTGRRGRAAADDPGDGISAEEHRRIHQAEISEKIEKEAMERQLNIASEAKKVLMTQQEPYCYRNADQMDGGACSKLRIFIDKKRESVVLPIYGMAVPFHISTIKNVAKMDAEGVNAQGGSLRINFEVPGVSCALCFSRRLFVTCFDPDFCFIIKRSR